MSSSADIIKINYRTRNHQTFNQFPNLIIVYSNVQLLYELMKNESWLNIFELFMKISHMSTNW